MSQARRPDYRLKAKCKITGDRTELGAAWVNEDGHINIRIGPHVCLTQDHNILLGLFPVDREDER